MDIVPVDGFPAPGPDVLVDVETPFQREEHEAAPQPRVVLARQGKLAQEVVFVHAHPGIQILFLMDFILNYPRVIL